MVKPCNQCGKCCINYSDGGLSASSADLELWELMRPDIFRYVRDGQIWMHPETGEQLQRCPWLKEESSETAVKRYTCDIYLDRPEDCRHYPVTLEQMIKDDCEMLEVKDLKNPLATQQAVDRLMADSRPPVTK